MSWRRRGNKKVEPRAFLTLALDEDGRFISWRKSPGTHGLGGWVGPIANMWWRKEFLPLLGTEPQEIHNHLLYKLSY